MSTKEDIRDFDAKMAAASLRMFGAAAPDRAGPTAQLDPQSDLVKSAVALLGDAKAWLDLFITPFEEFPGDWLTEVIASETPLGTDFFVACLEQSALVLEQVATLIELRPASVRPAS